MTKNDRCPVCDLAFPTTEQRETLRGGDGVDLCWYGDDCAGPRVDWRARALAAEAERADARRMLAAEREDNLRDQARAVWLRALVAALDAYAATDGRPWAERITARKRVDEARAAVARMEGGR